VDWTTEVEYIAALEATKKWYWIRKFIAELGVVASADVSIEFYCDNNGAIAQTKDPRSHQKSKHILRRYHLIREIVKQRDVKVCRVDTKVNTTDLLRKSLSKIKHMMHTISMGIRHMIDWHWLKNVHLLFIGMICILYWLLV
jgi:hypothetical protein